MGSSQDTLDRSFVLLAAANDSRLLGEIEGSNEEDINARGGGNLLNILNTGTRLNLHAHCHELLGTFVVLGAGVASGERVRGEHGAVATRSNRRVLAPTDNLSSINLCRIVVVRRFLWIITKLSQSETYL